MLVGMDGVTDGHGVSESSTDFPGMDLEGLGMIVRCDKKERETGTALGLRGCQSEEARFAEFRGQSSQAHAVGNTGCCGEGRWELSSHVGADSPEGPGSPDQVSATRSS